MSVFKTYWSITIDISLSKCYLYEKKLTVLFNNADEFKKRRLPVVYGFIKCYSRALGIKKLIIYKFSILLNKYIFVYIITCTCI